MIKNWFTLEFLTSTWFLADHGVFLRSFKLLLSGCHLLRQTNSGLEIFPNRVPVNVRPTQLRICAVLEKHAGCHSSSWKIGRWLLSQRKIRYMVSINLARRWPPSVEMCAGIHFGHCEWLQYSAMFVDNGGREVSDGVSVWLVKTDSDQ